MNRRLFEPDRSRPVTPTNRVVLRRYSRLRDARSATPAWNSLQNEALHRLAALGKRDALPSVAPVASATNAALRPSLALTDHGQSVGLHSEMSSWESPAEP